MTRVRTWAWGAFGALVGIALAVVVLATAVRSHGEPAPHVPRLLPESEGAISEVAMHYVPALAGVVRETYSDFLTELPDDVRVTVIVPEDITAPQRRQLLSWFAKLEASLPERTEIVPSHGPITTWSKDRALVTQPTKTGPAWLIPPSEPGREWEERYNDWLTVGTLAAASQGRFERHAAPFDFDAGDFAIAQGRVIVDANLIAKNRGRGITDAAALTQRLEAWLQAPVTVLGAREGDTPRHHLSMYMTPLHDDVVLVGDPRAARVLVGDGFQPGPRSSESASPLTADFSEQMIRRFDTAASELERQGFRVERVPNVPLEDKTYIAYTNGVYETRHGQRIAYVPMYGIDQLDAAARATYERLGWQVRPIRVRRVYPFHGTIGCLVNVLARR